MQEVDGSIPFGSTIFYLLTYHMMNDHDENVILVDEQDQPTGVMAKLEAHVLGKLHRAFSVIIFNPRGEILLQQRAMTKYHSRGLWTNACCSHPRVDEPMVAATQRRLFEEMNVTCPLHFITSLHYQTPPLDTGLIENELLHLYAGITQQMGFMPEPTEVMAWRWITPQALIDEVAQQPESFSYWFRLYLHQFDMTQIFSQISDSSSS